MGKKKSPKKRVWVPRNISSVAHPTRQAIIRCLEKGPRTAVDLEKELKESRYNLYHHLKTLADQGFIEERIDGRMKVYELSSDPKQSEELSEDVGSLTTVQQTLSGSQNAGSSAGGKSACGTGEAKESYISSRLGGVRFRELAKKRRKEGYKPSRELEVKGDVLNQILDLAGEAQVEAGKSYQVIVVESPPGDVKPAGKADVPAKKRRGKKK